MANEIKIDFPEDSLKELVAGWVMNQMSSEQKERVLAQAMAYLLTPKKESYQTVAISPLEHAFTNACSQVMHQVAKEMILDNEEIRSKIATKLGEGLMAWLDEDKYSEANDRFTAEIGLAIGRALGRRD